jgi:limonene 1,2-monooxygenase
LAGRYGFGLLCVAATQAGGYDALGINWRIAQETAAANGRTMDPAKLRLVGPVHLAASREEAWANVEHGGHEYAEYFRRISRPGQPMPDTDPIRQMVDEGAAVVGTPDDAIAQIRRLQEQQGDFGVFLQLAHNWADFDKTKKSYELWRRYVTPVINRANDARQGSFEWATEHAPTYIGAAVAAATATITRYQGAQPVASDA